jgi:hypothetical protein
MQGLENTHWYLHDRASNFSSREERLRIKFLVETGKRLIVAFFLFLKQAEKQQRGVYPNCSQY